MSKNLFSDASVSDVLDSNRQKIKDEVAGMTGDFILNASESDLVEYLVGKFSIESPTIRRDEIHALEPEDAKVDVSQEIGRDIRDRSRPVYVTGTRIVVIVPFDGEANCFRIRPQTIGSSFPRAQLQDEELQLIIEGVDLDDASVRQAYQTELRRIEDFLGWVRSDLEQFNRELPGFARKLVSDRREKLLKDAGLAAALGVPIRRRSEAALTFAPPEVRRKPPVPRPVVRGGTYVPEPSLPMEEYEFILEVIHRVGVGIERSPGSFAGMDEEDLRNVILVHLNGHYEGGATGETFNVGGKTDILIRHEDKNVFIAECKFWRGSQELPEAIDQVLQYVGWRDTKASLIVFNRNQDHTAVIQKIKEAVPQHPCFKRALAHRGESDLRYQFHQPGDKNREVLLAVLAFDVPASQVPDTETRSPSDKPRTSKSRKVQQRSST